MPHRADMPARYHGKVVGDGHCVALLREVGGLPPTSRWRRGVPARGGDLAPGTLIATFDHEGRYTNRTDGTAHAAVLIAETEQGLLVWDQWLGQPVHQRTIRFRGNTGDPVNNGDSFHAIELEET
ncbi:MAG TPA: BPSL0067 family protein [Acetobacteraceae bacterium]|jgi:hypothetical protein